MVVRGYRASPRTRLSPSLERHIDTTTTGGHASKSPLVVKTAPSNRSRQQHYHHHRPPSSPYHRSSSGGGRYSSKTVSPSRARTAYSFASRDEDEVRDAPAAPHHAPHSSDHHEYYGNNDHGASNERVCDYDTSATVLYELLESSTWERARSRCRSHPDEVRTWIVRKDKASHIRWRLLPLHAAIIFQSPNYLVAALLEQYPAAASRKDDQGMLPLHLAFRHKQEDEDLLQMLLEHYPKAVMMKDRRDRVPLEHGRESKFSAKVMKVYADATVAASRQASGGGGKDKGNHQHHHPIDSPTTTTVKTGLTTMTGDERAMLEAEHNEAMENLKREYEDQIRRLRGASGSQLKSLEHATENQVGLLRADYESQIRKLKEVHDRRIAVMHDHHQVALRQRQADVDQERRELAERHAKEMSELRDLLTNQVGRDKELTDSLEKEIAHLQVALQERRTEGHVQSTEYQELLNINKEFQDLLETVFKQHVHFQELLTQQQEDLEAARSVRHQLVQTLLRQQDDDTRDATTGQKLVDMTESLRQQLHQSIGRRHDAKLSPRQQARLNDRLQRDRATAQTDSRPASRLERARGDSNNAETYADTTRGARTLHHRNYPETTGTPTHEKHGDGEQNYGEVRILADEISAMTENSKY